MYRNSPVALMAVVVALGISSLVASSAFAGEERRNVPNADWGSEGATWATGKPIPCACPYLFPPISSQTSRLPDSIVITNQDKHGTVSNTVGSADMVRANSGTTEASAKTESESCWRPGMSRNIGIAERACDPFTSKPRTPPESVRSHSRKRH